MIYNRTGNYKIGFKYLYSNGKEIFNNNILQYIKSIKIPPAYNNVTIFANAKKILAYGYDSKNRKQVIYNPDFIKKQSKIKFIKYMNLRKYIHKIKNNIKKDLNNSNIKKKEIAIILYLILYCGFRIGNDKYLKENKTYGLTTLEYKHLNLNTPNMIKIEFIGKKGVLNKSFCKNEIIYNYLLSNKNNIKVFKTTSNDVNKYLKTINPDITTKDLRTWNANELFIKYMKTNISVSDALKKVALKLHNTVNVCKKNYIDPILFEKLQHSS